MNIGFLFMLEGIMFQFTGTMNNFANNLYATHLGATDLQLGWIQLIPNLAAFFLLLPLGILADRMKNIKVLPLIMLGGMGFGYFLLTTAPFTQGIRMTLFFTALAFTVGGTVLYTAQWQNFFGKVVTEAERNQVLTGRNRFMFAVSVAAPFLCGLMLNQSAAAQEKLRIYQLIFLLCGAASLVQMAVITQIKTPKGKREGEKRNFGQVQAAVGELIRLPSFRLFFIPIVLFYMFWQMDWSMWYIGQTRYLGLNESDLSIYNGILNIGQLFAIGYFSRVVQKKGNDFAICFGPFGLAMCPLILVFSSLFPPSWRLILITVLVTVLNSGQCTVNLCTLQILLKAVPEAYSSLAISLYTMTITLTNSFMPYLGVRLYQALGGDYHGFCAFFLLTAVIRFGTVGVMIWRYRYLKKGGVSGKTGSLS